MATFTAQTPMPPPPRREAHVQALIEADAQQALGDLFPHLRLAALQAAQPPRPAVPAPAQDLDISPLIGRR